MTRRVGLSLTYKFLILFIIVSIAPNLLIISSLDAFQSVKTETFNSLEEVSTISEEASRHATETAVNRTRTSLLDVLQDRLRETRDDKIDKYSRVLESVEVSAAVTRNWIQRSWQGMETDTHHAAFTGTVWAGPNNTEAWRDRYDSEIARITHVGPLLAEMDAQNRYLSLTYFTTTNDNLVISRDITAALPTTFRATERPWYEQAVDETDVTWTKPYVDANTKTLTTTATAPVRVDGQLEGAIGFDVTLGVLQEDILDTDPGFAFLLDADGEVVVFPGMQAPNKTAFAERTFRGRNLLTDGDVSAGLQSVAERMVDRERGVATVTIEGEESYVAYGPMETNDWSVGIVVPVSEVTAPATDIEADLETRLGAMQERIALETESARDRIEARIASEATQYMIILAFLGIFVIGSVFYVSRHVTLPLTELKEKAEAVSKGAVGEELKIETGDEIEELAESFNRVIRTVKVMQGRDLPAGRMNED